MLETEVRQVGSSRKSLQFGGVISELGREYAGTFLTEFAVMASQIIVYKLAAHALGKAGFSEYALARRTLSLMIPLPVMGLAVGLPRFMRYANRPDWLLIGSRYYGATLWCVGGVALLCILAMNVADEGFAHVFFGDRKYSYLAFPMSIVLLSLSIHAVVCAYFRGRLATSRANFLQFINLAVVPVLAFSTFGSSLAAALTAMGLMCTFVVLGALVTTPINAIRSNNFKEAKELVRYGIQRVPGDFILMALFTLPATFVAHLSGVQEAGFVAFGISVVSMIGGAFAPVGYVLLPKAASLFAENAHERLRDHVNLLLGVSVIGSIVVVAGLWIWLPALVRLYLGAGYEQVVPIARILLLGALPYSLYLVLRNLVDAYHEHGVTAAILAGGLAIMLIGFLAGRLFGAGGDILLVSFLASLLGLALLSGWETRRILYDQKSRG